MKNLFTKLVEKVSSIKIETIVKGGLVVVGAVAGLAVAAYMINRREEGEVFEEEIETDEVEVSE